MSVNRHLDHACRDLTCPLCQASQFSLFYQDEQKPDSRQYFCCSVCALVFMHPRHYLSPQEEKAVYDQHENSPDDPRYRHFLNRLFIPMLERLTPHSYGLDFGSGPGATLSVMLEEEGHGMAIYDPFYAPDISHMKQQYDFITASEVVEHLHFPGIELDRLWSCLKANGLLGIMTKRVGEQEGFSRWHYKNDPTHVCFFALDTFRWLADHWHATLTVVGNDAVIFTKQVITSP